MKNKYDKDGYIECPILFTKTECIVLGVIVVMLVGAVLLKLFVL